MSSYAAYLAETMVTLVIVCVVMYGVLYLAKRMGVGKPRGPIQLLGQLPLDNRRAIYLVRVAEQVLVVGASEAGLSRLGEVSHATLGSVGGSPSAAFSEVLGNLRGERRPASSETAAEIAEAKDAGDDS